MRPWFAKLATSNTLMGNFAQWTQHHMPKQKFNTSNDFEQTQKIYWTIKTIHRHYSVCGRVVCCKLFLEVYRTWRRRRHPSHLVRSRYHAPLRLDGTSHHMHSLLAHFTNQWSSLLLRTQCHTFRNRHRYKNRLGMYWLKTIIHLDHHHVGCTGSMETQTMVYPLGPRVRVPI